MSRSRDSPWWIPPRAPLAYIRIEERARRTDEPPSRMTKPERIDTRVTERRHEPRTAPHPTGVRGFWRSLGPGIVAGAADDDPSGIAT